MGVIKSDKLPTSLSPFSMRDIEEQARAILLRARRQAEQLLAAAQVEAEQMKLAAHAEGMAQGRRDGLAAGAETGRTAGRAEAVASHGDELKKAVAAISAAAAALESQRGDLESSALQDVVVLAIAIARRVTKRQGLIEPEVLAANLEQVMALVAHASDIRIAIRPEQRRTLDEALPKLQLAWPNLKHLELVDDPTLAAGGCRLYTRRGLIEADLDAQLDRVVRDLLPRPQEASS